MCFMSDFINDAVESAGLDMQVVDIEPDVYACTITSSQRSGFEWQRNITTKAGRGAPTLGNVLYYYALRAQDVSQYDDILGWSDDNERDLNDPQTIPDFKQLVQDKTDLGLLLGEPAYQALLSGLEISQAIHNAAGH
jgi:hypothetical protein